VDFKILNYLEIELCMLKFLLLPVNTYAVQSPKFKVFSTEHQPSGRLNTKLRTLKQPSPDCPQTLPSEGLP
jgi:hypothetical protein